MPAPAGTCALPKHPTQMRCSFLVGAAWTAQRHRPLTCCHDSQVSMGIQVITQKRILSKG